SFDPTKNRVASFATNGSNGRNVNVTVNGIDDKDNTVGGQVMQLPLEAVQEFIISTQRFSAVNGRSEGAAISVITKSGTNQVHGSLYFFDRDKPFNTLNYFEKKENGGSGTKSDFSRQQFGGSIGGPVRKDKDFLFFAYERQREQTAIVADPTAFRELSLVTFLGAKPQATYPTPYFDTRYNGRFDHRFNDKHSMFGSYSSQSNKGENDQIAATTDLTAGNTTINDLILGNVTFNSVLRPNMVNSFTTGYQYWHNLIDTDTTGFWPIFPGGIAFGKNPNVPQESYQSKWQFRDDLSITLGKHAFKTGFDYVYEPKLGGFFVSNGSVTPTFFDVPSVILGNATKYPQGFATPGAIQTITGSAGNPYFQIQGAKMFGLYVNDDWKVSRHLTLNVGVRWDVDTNLLGNEQHANNRTYQYLKAINNPYAGALPHNDKNNFSPRFGFAWDVNGGGKHIVRGGYGIYFGQVFLNIPLFAIQQSNATLFAQTLSISSAGIVPTTGKPLSQFRFGVDPLPTIPLPTGGALPAGSAGRLIDPTYVSPYTQQFNIGYAWAFRSDSVVEVDYVHTLSVHESLQKNINPIDPVTGVRPFTAAFTAAGVPVLGPVRLETSTGRSRYDGLNLSYRKRMNRHFSVNTNYVLSKAVGYRGNAGNFGGAASDPTHIYAIQDFGPTNNDERHRWVVSGLIDMPFGIKLSPIMQWASARPYAAAQGITDVFGYGTNNGATNAIVLKSSPDNLLATKDFTTTQLRACIADGTCQQVGFNNLRGQTFFQLDLRVSKTVKIGERARVELIFQAFDLTDRANFGNRYVGNIKATNFGQPNGFITPAGVIVPRSFSAELGAQFRF
ncbi:MAG TPA: hypothetical protein VGP79_18820, partial [Bryobacteraceae bacterium]|nr:hypothetical protein [Bryobacteraceae bacterium]